MTFNPYDSEDSGYRAQLAHRLGILEREVERERFEAIFRRMQPSIHDTSASPIISDAEIQGYVSADFARSPLVMPQLGYKPELERRSPEFCEGFFRRMRDREIEEIRTVLGDSGSLPKF